MKQLEGKTVVGVEEFSGDIPGLGSKSFLIECEGGEKFFLTSTGEVVLHPAILGAVLGSK